jgi:hypothetical protein
MFFKICITLPEGSEESSSDHAVPTAAVFSVSSASRLCGQYYRLFFFFQQADEWTRELIAMAATKRTLSAGMHTGQLV